MIMEVLEVVDRLKELGGMASLSSNDRQEIEWLYREVLDKRFIRTSCNDCYHDAVIEMLVYLKKNGKMKEKSNYGLKNGVLLRMAFGSSDFYTNANLTDEIAESYLAKYPENVNYFAKLPEDWKDRVEKLVDAVNEKEKQELLDNLVQSLKDGVSVDSISESFKDYKIKGRKLSKKQLERYIQKAQEIFDNEGNEESNGFSGEEVNEQK